VRASPDVRQRQSLRLLMLLCIVLVTHGSLYPWRLAWPADFAAAFSALMSGGRWWSGLGDVVGNIVLFVPVGALGASFPSARSGRGRTVLVIGGILFAYLLQVAQIFVPARDAAMSDVLWNTIGLVAGIAAAEAFAQVRATMDGPHVVGAAAAGPAVHAPALMLLALWLVMAWWPLVPTIDWQHIKDALKPLLLTPRWTTSSALETALSIAAIGHLLRPFRRRGLWLLGMIGLAVAGKLFIGAQEFSLSGVVGWLAGGLLVPALWRIGERPAALALVWCALAWFSADELRPYLPAEQSSSFHWIPFAALLEGSLSANTLALCWNTFWLGLLMVLAALLGARLGPLAVGLGLWVLLLEALQTWLPGRTADITPAFITWAWLILLRALSGSRESLR
jgi:VanZ family protein